MNLFAIILFITQITTTFACTCVPSPNPTPVPNPVINTVTFNGITYSFTNKFGSTCWGTANGNLELDTTIKPVPLAETGLPVITYTFNFPIVVQNSWNINIITNTDNTIVFQTKDDQSSIGFIIQYTGNACSNYQQLSSPVSITIT